MYRSNPTLYEWLNSPIVYIENGFRKRIAPLAKEYFSEKNTLYHYLNTARSNIKKFLQEDEVQPKKYFYALRQILACLWVLHRKSPPPVLFSELALAELPDHLNATVENLLNIKVNAPEKAYIPPLADLDKLLADSIEQLDEIMKELPKNTLRDWDDLNAFFIKEIGRVSSEVKL